ncbi:MAG TPA: PTS IIA-like nitrogen-regulatory protein PtsN [Porticoccaceae bacterium]|nr:PTS IIA-like nitrogen-regulatory protein PtsN [Porticoccaceae bacterium]HCO59047.1 PTS IIA-like nitrogen-regulatory protein PtsN [Porticoccaceae bacterium]
MNLAEVLSPKRTRCNIPGLSKKRVLESISDLLAEDTGYIDADELYHGLLNRERLGSTGIGSGIAIPHCRLAGCKKITGLLLKLETPVDFEANDDAEVDIIFALIVPDEQNDEHLQVLSSIAELLQSEEVRHQLRCCTSNDALYQTAISNC